MKTKLLGAIFILIWIAFMPLSAQQPKEIPPKPTDETYEYIPFPTGEAIWSRNRGVFGSYFSRLLFADVGLSAQRCSLNALMAEGRFYQRYTTSADTGFRPEYA